MNKEHYATRLKRELKEANDTAANLRERIEAMTHPEIPVYATIADGHGCLHFRNSGGQTNRSLSGCMDLVEVLHRANRAPVFDISGLNIRDLLAVSALPLPERVAALDSLFVPRIERAAVSLIH